MTHPLTGSATNRRNFLGLLGLSAATVAGGSLLAGCSKEATSKGAATGADAIKGVIPRFKAPEGAKPDIPGIRPVVDGYTKYPESLVQAVKDKPGSGGTTTYKAMYPRWGPTPPPLGSNAYVDAVNSALGVRIEPVTQDATTYGDKLSALLGARDVPDLISIPTWEIDKLPRFADAVKAVFEDLTDYLKGDAVDAYPLLASLSSTSWRNSCWNGRLAAVPYPTNGPFAWAMLYRKDLADKAGVAAPTSLDELYQFGKSTTNPGKGVWAFGYIFDMVQQFYGLPGQKGGWRKKSGGGLENKIEIPEFRQALEYTVRLYKEGLVNPQTIVAPNDGKTLFDSGKLLMRQDGLGAWKPAQSQQAKITPGYQIRALPVFGVHGDPVMWGGDFPIFYTFIKKGLGKDRTQEILRVLNFGAAPFGTKENELWIYGQEGKHFARAADHSPVPTDLGRSEITGQFDEIGGRPPVTVETADAPGYVEQLQTYSNAAVKFLEKDPFDGLKIEQPANYAKVGQPTVDKINDILYGRRPIGDLDSIIKEWRSTGGDEGRAFFEKVLTDNGR